MDKFTARIYLSIGCPICHSPMLHGDDNAFICCMNENCNNYLEKWEAPYVEKEVAKLDGKYIIEDK